MHWWLFKIKHWILKWQFTLEMQFYYLLPTALLTCSAVFILCKTKSEILGGAMVAAFNLMKVNENWSCRTPKIKALYLCKKPCSNHISNLKAFGSFLQGTDWNVFLLTAILTSVLCRVQSTSVWFVWCGITVVYKQHRGTKMSNQFHVSQRTTTNNLTDRKKKQTLISVCQVSQQIHKVNCPWRREATVLQH